MQLHGKLLTVGLVTTGLGAFTALGSRGLNSRSKLLFQPNMANAKAQMPSSLVHTSPAAQRPRLLTYQSPNQQVRLRAHGNWLTWRVHRQTGPKLYQHLDCSLVGP